MSKPTDIADRIRCDGNHGRAVEIAKAHGIVAMNDVVLCLSICFDSLRGFMLR